MEFQKRKEGVFQLGIYLSGRQRIEFRQTRDLIIALFSTSAFKRRKKKLIGKRLDNFGTEDD